ncbi:MAG: hypothetical protein ACI4TL_02040 [Candidatus Cryptobacteroides sp.]
MKTYRHIFSFLFPALLLSSCYQDLSTPARGEYAPIVLELSDDSDAINIGYGQTLELSASASQEGFSEDDLSYSWKMGIFVGSKYSEMQEISTTPELSALIVNTPSNDPYCLALTVSNVHDGYSVSKVWRVYVTSTLGDGLLVAHSRDGGESSILSLVSATPLTYGYKEDEPRVVDDVFGLANGGKRIKGRVSNLLSRMTTYMDVPNPKSFSNYRVMVATEDTLRMLDPLQYKEQECNEALFQGSIKFDGFKADTLYNVATCSSCALMGGYMYACMEILDHCYTAVSCPFSPANIFTKANTSVVPASQGFLCVFNPNDKCFYSVHGVFIAQSSLAKIEYPQAPSAEFLADKEAVAAGCLDENKNVFILKDGEDKYWLVKFGINDNLNAEIVELDLPEVDKALGFSFCDNSKVFYYYTPNAIYYTNVNASSVSARKLSFKPENTREKITMVKHYTQAWWGAGQSTVGDPSELYYYAFPISTNRMQIIVVTYNESTGEGKFYLKPYIVSTGMFNPIKDNGVYGGFGEISAVCSTLK